MESLTLAKNIYVDTVDDTRGQNFTDVADELDEQARNINAISERVNYQWNGVEAGPDRPNVDAAVNGLSEETKGQMEEALQKNSGDPEQASGVLADTAAHLGQSAKDLRAAAGEADMKNKEHDGETLAQAQLSQSGTETGDAGKMLGDDTVIDKDMAIGAGAHEHAHTEQVQQTISRASLDGQAVDDAPVSNTLDDAPRKGEVTSTQLFEAAAMVEQKRAAAGSFNTLTKTYQDTYRHVLSYVPDESRIVELAKREDGLEQLELEASKL